MAHLGQRISEINGGVIALSPARGNGFQHHTHQLGGQISEPRKLARVGRGFVDGGLRRIPGVAPGQSLIQGQAQRVQIAVSALAVVRDHLGIKVRWQVAARATSTRLLVVGTHRHIEVNDLRALLRPQQVARLDVAMVKALVMQVHQSIDRLLAQLQRIFGRQHVVADHVAHIRAFHVLEHQKGNATVWNDIRVQHAHHMRVLGDLHQVAVLLF